MRGRTWTDSERIALLVKWSEDYIQWWLPGAVSVRYSVILKIAEELQKTRIFSWLQPVSQKIKALKACYKEVVDALQWSAWVDSTPRKSLWALDGLWNYTSSWDQGCSPTAVVNGYVDCGGTVQHSINGWGIVQDSFNCRCEGLDPLHGWVCARTLCCIIIIIISAVCILSHLVTV